VGWYPRKRTRPSLDFDLPTNLLYVCGALHRVVRMKTLQNRIERYAVRTAGGCLEWRGYGLPSGYGRVSVGNKLMLVHRAVWVDKRGEIPAGIQVCHRCDNPKCCEIDHLFLGTAKDNAQDAKRKGRLKLDVLAQASRFRRKTKLSDEAVREIRQSNELHRILADRFGVSRAHISLVKSGKRKISPLRPSLK